MPTIGNIHLEPGQYGPFSFGNIVGPNTRSLKLTLTQTVLWPDINPCAIVTVSWDTGDSGIFNLNGIWRRRGSPDRSPTTFLEVGVPSGEVQSGFLLVNANVAIDFSAILEITTY